MRAVDRLLELEFIEGAGDLLREWARDLKPEETESSEEQAVRAWAALRAPGARLGRELEPLRGYPFSRWVERLGPWQLHRERMGEPLETVLAAMPDVQTLRRWGVLGVERKGALFTRAEAAALEGAPEFPRAMAQMQRAWGRSAAAKKHLETLNNQRERAAFEEGRRKDDVVHSGIAMIVMAALVLWVLPLMVGVFGAGLPVLRGMLMLAALALFLASLRVWVVARASGQRSPAALLTALGTDPGAVAAEPERFRVPGLPEASVRDLALWELNRRGVRRLEGVAAPSVPILESLDEYRVRIERLAARSGDPEAVRLAQSALGEIAQAEREHAPVRDRSGELRRAAGEAKAYVAQVRKE